MGPDGTEGVPPGLDPAASKRIFFGLLTLLAVGLATAWALKPSPTPPPPEVASNPLLARGREIYLDRCASCHGPEGKGDGPTARNIEDPPVGDLSDDRWKHGDLPEQVVAVIARGVNGAQMPGWRSTIGDDGVKAVAAYTYFLAGRDVPPELRDAPAGPAATP